MQKPPFRRRELNENVLIGLAFHKRQIWLHANVIVPFFSLRLSMLRDQNEVGADFERRQSLRFVPTRVKKEGFPFFFFFFHGERCEKCSKQSQSLKKLFWFWLFFLPRVCVCARLSLRVCIQTEPQTNLLTRSTSSLMRWKTLFK